MLRTRIRSDVSPCTNKTRTPTDLTLSSGRSIESAYRAV